jgi:hypothetical protein
MKRRSYELRQKYAGAIDFGLGLQLKSRRLAAAGAAGRRHQDRCKNQTKNKSAQGVH